MITVENSKRPELIERIAMLSRMRLGDDERRRLADLASRLDASSEIPLWLCNEIMYFCSRSESEPAPYKAWGAQASPDSDSDGCLSNAVRAMEGD